MIETKIVFYNSEKAMQKGIQHEQRLGWTVASTEAVQGGYSAGKTCCLAVIFFPLALLGRKPVRYKVQYQREKRR